jgi:hypothetical protein
VPAPKPESLEVAPAPGERQVRSADGKLLDVPAGWALLLPGDAGLTRRVKAAGPSWTMKEQRGRKQFSRGIWAPAAHIEAARAALAQERADPAYTRKLEAGRARRAKQELEYAGEFEGAIERFLQFAPRHAALGKRLAAAIAAHAVPVGSGTVARTKRIPIERRAEAATIAWLRHQTTSYDDMSIPRVKGMRREVRRLLAARSRELLDAYRRGQTIDPERCLLERGLAAAVTKQAQSGSDDDDLTPDFDLDFD